MSSMRYSIDQYPEGYVYSITPTHAQNFLVRNRTKDGVFYIAKEDGSAPLKRVGEQWLCASGEILFPTLGLGTVWVGKHE